jgi:Na+-transporting NADH:ubiquinone oxidoreductase subunit C
MATRSRAREGAYTLFFMLAVTVVFISATSATYIATKERVDRNAAAYVQRAILLAAGLEVSTDPQDIASTYARVVHEMPDAEAPQYYAVDLGARRAFVFLRDGAGLWGTIRAAVGFDEKLDGTMTGISVTSQNETPGLGARIDEAWFTGQFRGKRGPFTTKNEGEPTGTSEFDAITGATVTSNAIRDMLNAASADAPRVIHAAQRN